MQMADYAGRGSAAYDLEKFNATSRRRKNPRLVVAKPSLQQAMRARAKARVLLFMRTAAVAMGVVGFVVAVIYNGAMLSELNEKINAANAILSEEITETTRLATEVESKLSMRNVEDYATQKLGMAAMDKSQITYVNLSEGDKIELTNSSPKRSVLDYLSMAIGRVQEYIGVG